MTDDDDPTLGRLRFLLKEAAKQAGIPVSPNTINVITAHMRALMVDEGLVWQFHYDKAIEKMERR